MTKRAWMRNFVLYRKFFAAVLLTVTALLGAGRAAACEISDTSAVQRDHLRPVLQSLQIERAVISDASSVREMTAVKTCDDDALRVSEVRGEGPVARIVAVRCGVADFVSERQTAQSRAPPMLLGAATPSCS